MYFTYETNSTVMNPRRKFLLNSSLASLSLIVAKPYSALANCLRKIPGFTLEPNKLNLLVAGNFSPRNLSLFQQHSRALKTNWKNSLLIQAGNDRGYDNEDTLLDASFNSIVNNVQHYRTIVKGNIKVGIIAVKQADGDALNRVNRLAAFLKDEKKCHLVICLSQLGYKNKNSIDDLKLAENSANVDIIVGGNAGNSSHHPLVRRNKNNQEVIIQSAANNVAVSKIDLQFNHEGLKQFVDLRNLLASEC